MEAQRCPFVRIRNIEDSDKLYNDRLYQKAVQNTDCDDGHCNGSIMNPKYLTDFGHVRPKAEVLSQAKDFIHEFYTNLKMENSGTHEQRWEEIRTSIEETGSYHLTTEELQYGARTAWRNAPRCIGRRYWTRLEIFDGRHCKTAKEMFEVICKQMEYATNGGNIRSAISVFPHRTDGRHEYRVWNSQLLSYAGHKMPDDSILGDPINVNFTRICEKLGYQFKKTQYDILPLVLQANGEDPEVFQIPPNLVHEVHIQHPKYDIFEKMNLKWYAVPAVANMLFDCGGLQFPGAPFNGWYMTTEIAVRDFCDVSRLNLLPKLAEGMGFDITEAAALWKDRAVAEINYAIVQSFKRERTTIVDQYTAAETFMEHFQTEYKERGGCPADWVWLVPPISGSLCPVFHQEMISYKLKPSYDYQTPAWKVHEWKKANPLQGPTQKRFSLKAVAVAVKLCVAWSKQLKQKREKCTIVYATETGKAAKFSDILAGVFAKIFDVNVIGADEYFPVCRLVDEKLVLLVASTFGNGEAPGNGEKFFSSLEAFRDAAIKQRSSASMSSGDYSTHNNNTEISPKQPLASTRYAVFALGSRLYPNFCAFGHALDNIMTELGAERCIQCGEGDELKGQEQSFLSWTNAAFQAVVDKFYPGIKLETPEVDDLVAEETTWSSKKSRCAPVLIGKEPEVADAITKIAPEPVFGARLRYRKQLQAFNSDRKTLLVSIDRFNDEGALDYQPGDHLAVFPPNPKADIAAVLEWIGDDGLDVDAVTALEKLVGSEWRVTKRLPPCSMRMAVTRLLDLRASPQQSLLAGLSSFATVEKEKKLLEQLSQDVDKYETWKQRHAPNMLFLALNFPSARPSAAFLLDCLPLIKARYYSISSSPIVYKTEIHLTVALVEYKSPDDEVHYGMCTAWLNTVNVHEIIPCYIRKAPNFRLPSDVRTPVIMVGPGTGIAPFRSFWQERDYLRKTGRITGAGPMVLYFGCRSKIIDHIYERDMTQLLKNGTITDYQLALSRESGMPKTYVQDLMWHKQEEIYRHIMTENGHFYICGDVQMANDVKETLLTIFEQVGEMERSEAEDYLSAMKKSNRFHEDIFGAISVLEKQKPPPMKKARRRQSVPAIIKLQELNGSPTISPFLNL